MKKIDFNKLLKNKGKAIVYRLTSYEEYKAVLDWYVENNPIENYEELVSEDVFNKYYRDGVCHIALHSVSFDLDKIHHWFSFRVAHKQSIWWNSEKVKAKFVDLPYIKQGNYANPNKDRKKHTLQSRLNDTHYNKFNKLKQSYNKKTDTAMIEYMIDITPQNSEAENYLDKMFDNPIDQIDNLIKEDK